MCKFGWICSILVMAQSHLCIANRSIIERSLNETQAKDSLIVCAAHSEPYVYIDNGEVYDGIEYHLVNMIGKALNKKVLFVSGNEDVHKAKEHTKCDIIIGGPFVHLSDTLYHTASIPYDYDDIIWCTQRSKIIPKYLAILKILPIEMWFTAIFVGMFFSGIIVYFMVQFDSGFTRRNQMDMNYFLIIHVISTFVTNVHNFTPKRTIYRILYGLRIVMPILFNTVIGVSLLHYMKNDIFYYQITTLREIVDNNFRLAGSLEVLHMIQRTEIFDSDGALMFQRCNSTNHCLKILKRHESWDLVVGGFSQDLRHSQQFSASEIFCFDKSESLVSYPTTLIVKNEHKASIDTIIRRLDEFGIIQKLKSDMKSKKIPDTVKDDSPSSLQLRDISGLFIFHFFIGLVFPTIIWIFEMFVSKKVHGKKPYRFWYFIDRCIDGQRHYFKNLPEKLQNKYNKEHQIH